METISQYLLTFLLNASWQIPLIAAAAALAARLMRHGPASHRHVVWVSAFLASVFLPLASIRTVHTAPGTELIVQYASQSPTPVALAAPAESAPAPAAQEPRFIDFAQNTALLLLAAYVLFLLWRTVKLALAWRRTAHILASAHVRPMSPQLETVWNRCLQAFKLSGVELRSSSGLTGPVTAGLLRRTVILPDRLFDEGVEEVLLTAVGHEMAHIARRDFAMNLLYELLSIPVSFHPVTWILRRNIDRTREIACDELVVRRVLDAGAYARSIVSIASSMVMPPESSAALGVFDGDILEERIRRLAGKPASWKHARALLATGLAGLALCAVLVSSFALRARAQGGASDAMKTAAAAYNNGDLAGAVQHFESAVRLAPANLDARMFYANALLRLFFATKGNPSSPLLNAAADQYRAVLATEPQNKLAVRGMIAVMTESRKLQEAREWAAKLIQIDPSDKTAYYNAGVLDWAMIYPDFQRAKSAAGGRMEDYRIPDAKVRKTVRDTHDARLEEGFRMLQTALQLDPRHDDSMAYLNLLYRLKSGWVESDSEAADLLAKADEWVGKALAAKRQRPKGQTLTQGALDVDGPPPGPPSAHAMIAAPPPPPPPPPPQSRENQIASTDPPPTPRAVEQPGTYWQVVASRDMPAKALVGLLREKGFASALHHTANESAVRVMAGPYFDQPSIDRARTALEAAGFRPLRAW